jgi:lysine-specific demethylase 3
MGYFIEGPKMYNAQASSDKKGSCGTTALHMDMSDAMNVMSTAADTPQRTGGYAIWDIFKAKDSESVRRFLRDEHPKLDHNEDPIHLQHFYLDNEMLAKLYRKQGVTSHRIYQTPNQAVFIPAGCAHQVRDKVGCVRKLLTIASRWQTQLTASRLPSTS